MSINRGTDKDDVVHIYTMGCYSAIKKNEIMPLAATWMQLEISILSKVNQKQKDNSQGNEVVRKQCAVCSHHFFRLQSGSFVELPTVLCRDRASGGSQPLWFIRATTRRVQGRMYHFQWKTSGGY